ncbi:MAG TPA: F0F1 ATP synthase subunit epsilon [Actinomycetales bacterium]|nr:F0F1 ATP synthase subunit epsilon [Actinomycetales bacterium]
MAELQVELVAADRKVWSGEASLVVARSTEGELGVMPGHTPLLGVLVEGEVRVTPTSGQVVTAHVDGGFLSVEHDHVVVVAEALSIGEAAAARSRA